MPAVQPFSITRTFNAPRALVYKVHTQAEHMEKWMSPPGFKTIHSAMDLRVGGSNHYGMQSPDGHEMWGLQIFKEIVEPEKLVYVQSFSDKDRNITAHPMSPTWPKRMLATLILKDLGSSKTELTITWLPYEASDTELATFDAARPSMSGGFQGVHDALDAYLASIQ
jgi:uncharacterized protein YndB with AHSA1/START domain